MNDILKMAEEHTRLLCRLMDGVREMAEGLASVRQEELSKLPYRLNVISAAVRGKLHETGHSMILADMLKVPFLQKSFVDFFLHMNTNGQMVVMREAGNSESHIDVLLYDDERFIVVENKVNNAEEQHQQIYRYVHDIGELQFHRNRKDIYVIYLNPRDHSAPSAYSVKDSKGEDDMLQSLGDRFIIRSFAYDIVDWLSHIQKDIPEQEVMLKSAIMQYEDYLQNYFETLDIYKDMKEATKQYILDAYELNEADAEQRIRFLEDKKEDVNKLLESMEEVLKDARTKVAGRQLKHFLDLMKSDYRDLANVVPEDYSKGEEYPKVVMRCSVDGLVFNLGIEYGRNEGQYYYGVNVVEGTSDAEHTKMKEIFEDFFVKKYGDNKYHSTVQWPLWMFEDNQQVYGCFKELMEYAKQRVLEKGK